MSYTDIHIHALWGVDDGAQTEAEMFQMIEAAYGDGARQICLTPHFHPGGFGDNRKKTGEAFDILRSYAAEKHPDLELYLGNELRYSRGCVAWLDDGICRTLAGTNFVLVDFAEGESIKTITGGLDRLLNGGYTPILAHAERYDALRGNLQLLRELRADSVLLQVDSQAVLGGFGLRTRLWTQAILGARLADIVASDAHDLRRRPPGLGKCHACITRKFSAGYADALCRDIPGGLLLETVEGRE